MIHAGHLMTESRCYILMMGISFRREANGGASPIHGIAINASKNPHEKYVASRTPSSNGEASVGS